MQRSMQRSLVICAAVGLWLAASAQAAQPEGSADFRVMTQNQYLGAELSALTSAPDPAGFIAALEEILLQIAANNFPDRVQGLARQIADQRPAVVGLQEAFNFTVDVDGAGPMAPMNGPPPFVDHVAETLSALAALGEDYVALASVQNLSIAVPDVNFPGLGQVTLGVTDRDVILVRGDLVASAVAVPFSSGCARPSADGGSGCNYQFVAEVPVFFPPFVVKVERGYVGVDIQVGERVHRVVNTHLEIQRPDGTDSTLVLQALQAAELIQTLAATPNPTGANVVIIGDINSDPNDPVLGNPGPFYIPPFDQLIVPPYQQLTGAGYTDAWTLRPGTETGLGHVVGSSCCQLKDLSNHRSELYRRIDVIFSAAAPSRVVKARVLGDRVSDKTPTYGLWPSDHGAVTAQLRFD